MRVLHLVESEDPDRSPTSDVAIMGCRASLEQLPDLAHDVWLLADTRGEARARELGLRTSDRLGVPSAWPLRSWPGMRALRARRPRPDVVHAWGTRAARAARWTFGRSARVTEAPDVFPVPGRVSMHERDQLRAGLGLAPGEGAVLVLAEPEHDADAHQHVFLAGLLEYSSTRATCVFPAGAHARARSRWFHRRAVLDCRLVYSNLPALALAPACEVGVLHTRRAPGAPSPEQLARRTALVLCAHRAGLPVVAAPESGTAGVCDAPGLARLVSPSYRPADYARTIVPLLRDRTRLREVSQQLVARARERVARDDAPGKLRRLWERGA